MLREEEELFGRSIASTRGSTAGGSSVSSSAIFEGIEVSISVRGPQEPGALETKSL